MLICDRRLGEPAAGRVAAAGIANLVPAAAVGEAEAEIAVCAGGRGGQEMPAVAAWQAVRQADLLPGRSTSQQLLERIGPDVAAADDAYDDGAGRWRHPAGGQGGESRGARGFCGELAPLDQQANRVDDLQVGNSHHLVHETLDVPEGVFAGEWRGQAVRDGVDLFQM